MAVIEKLPFDLLNVTKIRLCEDGTQVNSDLDWQVKWAAGSPEPVRADFAGGCFGQTVSQHGLPVDVIISLQPPGGCPRIHLLKILEPAPTGQEQHRR